MLNASYAVSGVMDIDLAAPIWPLACSIAIGPVYYGILSISYLGAMVFRDVVACALYVTARYNT